MLKSLIISNYALIDKVEIKFEKGLSVITGETGAGKSVLLGALSLILGQRSDINALLDKTTKCVVEGEFYIADYGLVDLFNANDVDYETTTIIRRELLPSGKSRAFVNDTPVNLGFLKSMSDRLIDVHSQHQNLLLSEDSFHLSVVDVVADNGSIREEYKSTFHVYKTLKSQINALIEQNDKQKADLDYMQFQYDQLESAQLKAGELVELELNLERLSHAEDIKTGLSDVISIMEGEPAPLIDALGEALHKIQKISSYLEDGEQLAQRLESAYIDLKDLNDDVSVRAESVEFDPQAIQKVQQRLDLIYNLQQKHRLESVEALIALRDELAAKIEKINLFDEQLDKLKLKMQRAESDLSKIARRLTKSRQEVFYKVKTEIENPLKELGMPHANFVIEHKKQETYSANGCDRVEFLFAANKNGTPSLIHKVASGGEMSRVMLSIKSLLSSAKGLPTIIFDEIDTGVSGEVADKMGRIMVNMGRRIQVISITHLPQITVKGGHHYKVFKTDNDHQTISQIKKLNHEERIVEVAKMLSGSEMSEAALVNARTLLSN
ncbi:MAG: DNA repair protein RecN [Marinilabiliaceae bacterium]|nr:DNA repair protein RecN [Marinilabiliaceae bacterium]